jgi:hypothetical protein
MRESEKAPQSFLESAKINFLSNSATITKYLYVSK